MNNIEQVFSIGPISDLSIGSGVFRDEIEPLLKGSIYLLSSFFKPSNYRKVDEHHRIITPFDGPRSVYFESFNDGKIIVLSTLARYRGILSRDGNVDNKKRIYINSMRPLEEGIFLNPFIEDLPDIYALFFRNQIDEVTFPQPCQLPPAQNN